MALHAHIDDRRHLVSAYGILRPIGYCMALSAVALCVAWGLAASVAALANVRAVNGSPGHMVLEYRKFASLGDPLSISVSIPHQPGEWVTIGLDAQTAARFKIERTAPVAATIADTGDGASLTFDTRGSHGLLAIELTITPREGTEKWGQHDLVVSAAVAQRLKYQQFASIFIAPI